MRVCVCVCMRLRVFVRVRVCMRVCELVVVCHSAELQCVRAFSLFVNLDLSTSREILLRRQINLESAAASKKSGQIFPGMDMRPGKSPLKTGLVTFS